MTLDARTYSASETLRDGRAVTIRAIRASDKQAMLDAFHGLDPHTVYLRVFSALGEPDAKTLRDWTEIDFDRLVRLVVCLPRPEGGEQIIGGASFAMLEPGNPAAGAEVSFTIEEDFQGQGLGGKLLTHLARPFIPDSLQTRTHSRASRFVGLKRLMSSLPKPHDWSV